MATKTTDKKKRKNPWPARRRNKRYREINNIVDGSPEVNEALLKSQDILNEVGQTARHLKTLKDEYDSIMKNKISSMDEVFETLPIENLKDLSDCEKNGRPEKPQFRDILRANDIKRRGQSMVEMKQSLVHDAQVVNIELLQAKIAALIKISEDDK